MASILEDDLTAADLNQVLAVCQALVMCGQCVLHGSTVKPALNCLHPRQANDAIKVSGNHCGVYAGVAIEAVLMHAAIDRAYLSSRFASYRLGYRTHGGRLQFRVSANVFRLIEEGDTSVCTQGYVYVLDRARFVPSPECEAEFYSRDAVVPIRRLKLSQTLGAQLLRVGDNLVALDD